MNWRGKVTVERTGKRSYIPTLFRFFVFALCLRWCAGVELTVSLMDRHENWSNDPAYPTKYTAISVIGLFSQLLTDSVLTWSMTFKLAQTCAEQLYSLTLIKVIYDVFNHRIGSSDYIALIGRAITELERMRKEIIVTYS